MRDHSLSRDMIAAATSWGPRIVRGLLMKPYRLQAKLDPPSHLGGGRVARFRLSDVLFRARNHPLFTEDMAKRLITADAEFRNANATKDKQT